jgi:hypothetical protein
MLINIQDRVEIISRFLTPVVKMSDSARISVQSDRITALVASPDNSLILFAKSIQDNSQLDDAVNLNVPNVTRLINLLSCLNDTSVAMEYDNNQVVCKSGDLKFMYHLLDDDIIKIPGVDIEKIRQLDINTSFFMTKDTLTQLIKASSFTTDTDKLYISSRESKIIGELTDKQQANVDSFSRPISMSYTGDELTEPIAINFELFRMIGALRLHRDCKIIVRVNSENGVVIFDIVCDDNKLKYITSAYAE